MIKTAAVVAAGFGSRLNELTASQPKGFLEIGGRALIERSLATVVSFGVTKIVIGTGYEAGHYQAFARAFGERHGITVETVHSEVFATTGSMYTLWNMRKHLTEPFLLLESDLLYEPKAIALLAHDPRPDVILASDATGSGDEVYIETDADGNLVQMSKDKSALGSIDAELVGITKVSRGTFAGMCATMEAVMETQPKLDYESALVVVSQARPIPVLRSDGLAWCEIDDAGHLSRALGSILPRVEAAQASAGCRL